MTKTIQAIALLQQIAQTTKSSEKAKLIQQGKCNEAFLMLLNFAFNPFIITNLKKVEIECNKSDTYKKSVVDLAELINYLTKNNRSNTTLKRVEAFLHHSGKECELFKMIITKSLKIGISTKTINKALGEEFIPDTSLMKAYDYSKIGSSLVFPMFLEEKLDGVRCVIIKERGKVKAFTYNGSVLELPHIFNEIKELKEGVYDGELLANTRQSTSGIVNKVINHNYEDVELLTFNIFDYISLDDFYNTGDKILLLYRKNNLDDIMNKEFKYLKKVKYKTVWNKEEVTEAFNKFKAEGKEGLMLKEPNSIYERKRSKAWIKMKAINSVTLRVIDIELGEGKYKGKIGVIVCQTEDKQLTLKVGSGLTDKDRNQSKEYWLNKIVEVEYTDAYYLDDKLIIDFPRFKTIRVDKDKADTIKEIAITRS